MNLLHDLPPRLAAALLPAIIAKGPAGGVYLTFDDGPDPLTTPLCLSILAGLNCRGTFFLSGESVARHPEIARKIAEAGHEVGSHGFQHRSLAFSSEAHCSADIYFSIDAIIQATGQPPRFFRPPYGRIGVGVLSAIRRLNLTIALWSLSAKDWKATNPDALADRIIDRVRDGDVILLHDAGQAAPIMLKALPDIVYGIRAKGLRTALLPDDA